RLLRGDRVAHGRRRHLPSMAAGLRGRRSDRAHGLRHARVGVPGGRDVGAREPRHAPRGIEEAARSRPGAHPSPPRRRALEERVAAAIASAIAPVDLGSSAPDRAHRIAALRAFDEGDARRVVSEWRAQPEEPRGPSELAILADALAALGDEGALPYIDSLRA